MKALPLISLFTIIWFCSNAQYCGNSGSFDCPGPDTSLATGFFPLPDSFPELINNTPVNAIIQFRNLDSIIFGTEVLHVYSITFDTIGNLPSGLCWATDQANNTYVGGQTGCLQISGTPCANTGQYELDPLLNVDIGVNIYTDGEPGGLKYYLRLKNYGDADTPVDSTQADSIPFTPYGGACAAVLPLSVSLGPDQAVCNGSFASLFAAISGGQPPFTYLWQSTGGVLNCDTCTYPVAIINQNSSFVVIVSDVQGTTATDTVNYTAVGTTTYNFQITPPGPILFCDTGTIVLASAPQGNFSYQWYLNNSIATGATDSVFTVTDSSGTYMLAYSLSGVCTAQSNSVTLSFFNTPFDSIASLGSPNLCQGSYVLLNAYTSPNVNYQWQLNNAPVIDSIPSYLVVDTPGVYDLIVYNAAQCSNTSNQITIVSNPNFPPDVELTGFTPDSLCFGSSPVALTGGVPDGGYYTGPGVISNSFYPDSGTIGENFITYVFTDTTGCSNWATAVLVVEICTEIKEASDVAGVLIYPNPATDQLTIESALLNNVVNAITIYDISGRQMFLEHIELNNNMTTINTSALSPGLYVVQISTPAVKVCRRFLKIE